MPLEIKSGDVFENITRPTVIAHGCNNRGVMGAGIALTIKTKYPEAYDAYIREYRISGLPLGSVIFSHVSENLTIANCITQELYVGKRPLNYAALVNSLQTVIDYTPEETAIRLPFIGGGLGGGNPDFLIDIYSDLFYNTNNATLYIKE